MSAIQEITHLHHKIPRHMGGTDSSDNLERLTIAEHAEAHRQLWLKHHNQYDFIAWQSLSGQITHAEATRLAQSESGKRRSAQGILPAQQWSKQGRQWGHKSGYTCYTKKVGLFDPKNKEIVLQAARTANIGRKFTEEQNNARSKRFSGSGNHQFGTQWKWITDGYLNKKVKRDAEIPEGWHKGRTL